MFGLTRSAATYKYSKLEECINQSEFSSLVALLPIKRTSHRVVCIYKTVENFLSSFAKALQDSDWLMVPFAVEEANSKGVPGCSHGNQRVKD